MKKKYIYLIIILLMVATFAAFGRIAQNYFINFDDEGYITENNHIKSGINPESIKWAFTSVFVSNWVPLAMLSHMVDWRLFGADTSGHHLMSLLLHIGAVIFLFLFLYKTTNNIWPSAFAAAFFALHPLRVESVAWASERKDVLSMFFGMATLWAYAFYAKKPKLSSYITCLLLFTLSLLSKSMLITLPFVLLLLDYWPLGRWQQEITAPGKNIIFNRLIGEKIPFFILTITFSVITFLVQYEAGSVYPALWARIFNAIVAYVAYLGKTLWPVDLTLVYYYEYSFSAWQIIVSFLLLIVITAIVIYFIKRRPYLFVGWFWYLGTLVPVIGLVPTSALLADHYTYLPSVGIALMLSWGIESIIRSEEVRRKILIPAAIILFAILIVLSWNQCGYWNNDITLFSYTLQKTKDNYLAHAIRGNAYNILGQYQKAIEDSTEAIRLNPNDSRSYYTRGDAYSKLGEYQRAIKDYNEAIRIKSNNAENYSHRGNAYYKLGQYQRAIEDYNEAINLKSDDAEVYYNRGNAHVKIDQYQLAIEDYNKAIVVNNNYIKAYNNRGVAYYKLGQYGLAVENYNKAILLKSDYTEAYYNRGNAYLYQGNYKQSCLDARKACELGICKLLKKAEGKRLCR